MWKGTDGKHSEKTVSNNMAVGRSDGGKKIIIIIKPHSLATLPPRTRANSSIASRTTPS